MRDLLHRLDYGKKDAEQIGAVDPLIVGRAAVIFERGEHTARAPRPAARK